MDATNGPQWWFFDIGRLSDHTCGDGDDFILIESYFVYATEVEIRQHADSRLKYWETCYSDSLKGSNAKFLYFSSDQGYFVLSEGFQPTGDSDPENPKYKGLR